MAAKTTMLVAVSSCLLLAQQLLLLVPATTAISIHLGGGATATAVPVASPRDSDDNADAPPFFPGGSPAAAGCWNAVLRAEICAGDILRSVASLLLHDGQHPWSVHVGAPCCGVLQAVGDRCFRDLLTDSPFRPLYTPFVNQVCGLPVSGGVTPGQAATATELEPAAVVREDASNKLQNIIDDIRKTTATVLLEMITH